MNIKELRELVNLMNENNLGEVEIEKEGMRVHLKKTQSPSESSGGQIVVERYAHAQAPSAAAHTAQESSSQKTVEIKAPMVGTFYRAPSPEAAPFIETGGIIEPGQVICIIEAMKLMNEIKSEIKGRIIEILVDNAEPVEFGQPMFLVEPL